MNQVPSFECPCCGQVVEGVKLLADPGSRRISHDGKMIYLQDQHFRLAQYLIRKFPATATKEEIYDNVFMHANGEGPGIKIVDVIICKVRPSLADLGLVIETVWGKGYRLVEADPEQASAIKEAGIRARGKGLTTRWKPEHNDKLLELMKRKYKVAECASIMRMPYTTVERHMKELQPLLRA